MTEMSEERLAEAAEEVLLADTEGKSLMPYLEDLDEALVAYKEASHEI